MSDDLLFGAGSITHHFIGPSDDETEVYLKRAEIKPGSHLIQHSHNYAHAAFLVKGDAAIKFADGVWHSYSAPACIHIPANFKHEVMTAGGCVWYCAHATDEGDETKVDDALTNSQVG